MSNVSDLKAALVAAAASITATIERLECLADIDDWYNCRVAIARLSSTDVSSYSYGGKSVTRKDLPSLEGQERSLYARIYQRLYLRGAALADLRSDRQDS